MRFQFQHFIRSILSSIPIELPSNKIKSRKVNVLFVTTKLTRKVDADYFILSHSLKTILHATRKHLFSYLLQNNKY